VPSPATSAPGPRGAAGGAGDKPGRDGIVRIPADDM
jgi:hypothetical protein